MEKQNETINLNGKEYILKEEFDKVKIEQNVFPVSIVTDNCNVMGIVGQNKDELSDEIEINFKFLELVKKWKVIQVKDIKKVSDGFEGDIRYIFKDTKYSEEFVKKAQKIAKLMFYSDVPEIYLALEEDGTYKKDYPCLIVFARKLIFLLAPRVEEPKEDIELNLGGRNSSQA